MVVVDEARKLLGRQVDVVVTSVLQTTSGRMIFGKLKELADKGVPLSRGNKGRRTGAVMRLLR